MRKFILIHLLCFSLSFAITQKPSDYSSVDIYQKIEKLNFLGTALYVAAHPDDENTRLISFLSNHTKARTAYLSLTRGDGGQNRIGTDIREKLGVIRTHELLEARKIDGGQQFFSRASDFGYSKNPSETLSIWDKDDVVQDMIKVVRTLRPDIVINRFDHRRAGRTHGHHTSSAMLSLEVFDLAGNADSYPDRLGHLEPWSPTRLYFNTGWWFYGSRENFDAADKSNFVTLDVGAYDAIKGVSNTEIAARSRSMHKSQGFGSTGTRGEQFEYLELVKGASTSSPENLFEGINTTWSRVEGGQEIQGLVDVLLYNYNFRDPSFNIPRLIEIHKAISAIQDDFWREIKLSELEEIIVMSAGLYLEMVSKEAYVNPGDAIALSIEATNRTNTDISLNKVEVTGSSFPLDLNLTLDPNTRKSFDYTSTISEDQEYSNPYWLNSKGSLGMYRVDDFDLIGRPVEPAISRAKFTLTVGDLTFDVSRDVVFKRNDPVDGEVYTPFFVMPEASISFTDPVYIFPNRTAKDVRIRVKSYKDNFKGQLSIKHPASWIVSPRLIDVDLKNKNAVAEYVFSIKGPLLSESAELSLQMLSDEGIIIDKNVSELVYDHIPKKVIIQEAKAKFERISLEKKGSRIAYIEGAGDAIPESLIQIGYNVDILDVEHLTDERLADYDAVVVGIRAYNVKPDLKLKKEILMGYIHNGGTVLVQYNTNRGLSGDDIAPYPMTLSRDRVTDENAKVSFMDAEHEVLNYPNKISSRDFENWVQERGLYFPNQWDSLYQAPIACSDALEGLMPGGLLIAKYGDGHFIYTGYSWFRQLPAGVPGAFRLFANLLSIGRNEIQVETEDGVNK